MKKLFLIDRDGTINVEKGYVHRPEDLEFIAGSLEALRRIHDAQGLIYIITNQAGIAKGLYDETTFRSFNRYFLERLGDTGVSVRDVLYCPHHPEGVVPAYRKTCDCRKPGNRLLKAALEREGLPASRAVMVGDRNTDMEAARSLEIESYLVLTGYGAREKENTPADRIVRDLKEAVELILNKTRSDNL